jgi:hypothetical protein
VRGAPELAAVNDLIVNRTLVLVGAESGKKRVFSRYTPTPQTGSVSGQNQEMAFKRVESIDRGVAVVFMEPAESPSVLSNTGCTGKPV